MISREELSRLSARFRINETILEKDYVLTICIQRQGRI